ncbi:MAG TPA: hypothetical protein VGP61_01805 [Gemmatimonadales bacterium]|jgi:hypothetical protein|nr:hypothetical protein [Gemmatimonadales bacterium]
MPVTARLLQRLHESLGDDATNDLFSWWEEAATVNRAAVREVADLYYARFDARLEKGLAEVRSEMANQRADLIKWMFIFWVGTVVPLGGLVIALTKL